MSKTGRDMSPTRCRTLSAKGIDLPVRRLLAGDVFGARMTDTHVLDLGTAIDQQGLGIGLQEIVGGNGSRFCIGFP
jgi:hypothetical protein